MEEYSINFYTKNQTNVNQIKNIIWSTHKLGYFFKYKGTSFSPEEAFDFLFNEKGTIEFINNVNDYFYAYTINKKFRLRSNFLRKSKLFEFKHGVNPNIISLLKFFLNLTESFLLSSVVVKSDLNFFYNLESSMSHEYADNSLSVKKQAKDPNAIHAYVFVKNNEFVSDASDIVNLAAKNQYQFIDDPKNQKMLDFSHAFFNVSKSMNFETLKLLKENFPSQAYLKVDNFIMKLVFNYQLLSLYPIEPFKMKMVDGETGIDIAFYLTIYLNLVEPFGIDDLITTFYKKLEFDIELADRLIKMHNMPWNFIEDFYRVLEGTKELNYLKDLDKLLAFNLNEIVDNKTIKDTLSDMKNFLELVKSGNEMAKELGKNYIFYSTNPIPYVIKEWFKQNNITFKEKTSNGW